MTEQMLYKIYKISNSENDRVYIGSTRQPSRKRWHQHKREAREGCEFPLHKYMRALGVEKFKYEVLREIIVSDAKTAKIQEQIEIWKYENPLNENRAHIPTHNYCNDKKRASRRAFYHRHKADAEWHAKEKVRNINRMKLKRQDSDYRAEQSKKDCERRKKQKDMRTCICGSVYNYGMTSDRYRHYRGKKHTDHVNLIYEKLNVE